MLSLKNLADKFTMKQILLFIIASLLTVATYAQQGVLEYQTTISGGPQPIATASTMYFLNGNIRNEVAIALPGGARPMKQTMLMLTKHPNMVYMLHDATKTYTETSTEQIGKHPQPKLTVKIIGKEMILGLNCVHASVDMGKTTMDIWTTKDIPGYEKMLSYWKSNPNVGGENLYNELKNKGAAGFVVRTKNNMAKGGMTMELVRYDPRPAAASLFEIPQGYKKGASFDSEKMKNMSPAERQKLMQQMMKK